MQRATEALAAPNTRRNTALNPLDYVMAEIGGNTGRGLSGTENKDADQLGAHLDRADRRRSRAPIRSFAFVADAAGARCEQHPLAETVSFRGWRSGPGGDALDVQFSGADAATLKAAAEALKARARRASPRSPPSRTICPTTRRS